MWISWIMILQKMLTYSLFKWFYNRFFYFSAHNGPWFVKKNVDVLMKKYEKNFEMMNKKMFILKLLINHFFLQFFFTCFFFYIRCKYGRINNLNNIQCRYWISDRCGWITDLNYHLQHWNSCLTVAHQDCLDCPRWPRIGRRISSVFLPDWLFSFWYWFRFKVQNPWDFSSFWNDEK